MLVARAARRLRREVLNRLGPKPDWLKKKAKVDREFDRLHGVNTGGYTRLSELKIDSPSWREGNSHIAADPDEFHQAMAAVDADLSGLTFIDLGSGKGRALMLAKDYPFKRLIGVEFSEELVRIARGNGVETIHGDATEYELPNEPTLLLLYNPFGRPIMDVVARNTRASLEKSPRELIVLYLNPFHLESWTEAGFKVSRGEHFAVVTL